MKIIKKMINIINILKFSSKLRKNKFFRKYAFDIAIKNNENSNITQNNLSNMFEINYPDEFEDEKYYKKIDDYLKKYEPDFDVYMKNFMNKISYCKNFQDIEYFYKSLVEYMNIVEEKNI